MATALAALGSNLGDRAATLQNAVDQLSQTPWLKLLAVSRWHETTPVGGPAGQDPFLNGAVLFETTLSPLELWQVFQEVEQAAARQREVTWGPRSLDVDLLLYDEFVLNSPELTIPHPRMMFRRFVIEPAAEIAPKLYHPLLGWRLEEIKDHLATAQNYLALFAPPGYAEYVRALAANLQKSIPSSVLIADPQSTDDLLPSICTRAACLATIERHAQLTSQTCWPETAAAIDELLVSDFWFGQGMVEASAWLQGAQGNGIFDAWQATFRNALCPKLVVCLFDGDCTPNTKSPLESPPLSLPAASRPCGIPLNREQLNHWKETVLGMLTNGFGGPWVMVDLSDPAAALTEVAAAALAMR